MVTGLFHDTGTANYKPEDFRFTTKGDLLYAIGLAWPSGGEAVIHSLASAVGGGRVQSVTLLDSDANLRFDQRANGLHVMLPAQRGAEYAYALRLTFDRSSR